MNVRRTVTAAAIGVLIIVTSAFVSSPAHAIVRGETVESAPWAASVLLNGEPWCSGVIIAPEWVLTARHCVQGTMSVRIGSVESANGGEVRAVVSGNTHYDLALLHLDSPVDTTYLPLADVDPPARAQVSIYGWGKTCAGSSACPLSPVLKVAEVSVLTPVESRTDAYGGPVVATDFITGYATNGDSGGPMIYEGAQVGVASTADGQGFQKYSSVAAGLDWIHAITGV